jgi:hypothetical protein
MMMLNNMHNAMARPNLLVRPSNITYLVSLSKISWSGSPQCWKLWWLHLMTSNSIVIHLFGFAISIIREITLKVKVIILE